MILLFFAVSFTIFSIQSSDVLMYLALARDFLTKWSFETTYDPYLYSLKNSPLVWAHEYLSYGLFYGAYQLAGFAGLILLKAIILAAGFILVLRAPPQTRNASWPWLGLWVLAVIAGSFRFIERSSLISDLFCLILTGWLLETHQMNRRFIFKVTSLFFLWIQFHAGFPVGLALLAIWCAWHLIFNPLFEPKSLVWLTLPIASLFLNPLGWNGVAYPFEFAQNEAQTLRHFNFEWFPSYHPAFHFTPEVCAFWALSLLCVLLIVRERSWLSLRSWIALFAFVCALLAVRFIPWSAFVMIMAVKPWCELRAARLPRWVHAVALGILVAIGLKNFSRGYNSSSGQRSPGFELDPTHFPLQTFEFLSHKTISGRVYNSHDFGAFLIWKGFYPVFHHGFVTDMDFYRHEVIGAFESKERFLELANKYGWTMLLVDKLVTYPLLYPILAPLPEWKIVAEDSGSYLIYRIPDVPQGH